MSLNTLPSELLAIINSLLSHHDLALLSATSSRLNAHAQPVLYHDLVIDFCSPHFHLIPILAHSPSLASLVRNFALRVDPSTTILPAFYLTLRRALSHMLNLRSLDLSIHSYASWALPHLPHLSYSNLSRFATSLPLDTNLLLFLSHSPNLTHLEADSFPSNVPLPSSSIPPSLIPSLSQFIGSSRAAQSLVPGRPLQVIHINSGDLSLDVIHHLALASAPVKHMGANTAALPTPLLEALTRALPSLQSLRMMTTFFEDAPEPSFYQDVAITLRDFPDLHSFELSGMYWNASRKVCKQDGVWCSNALDSHFTVVPHDDFYSEVFAY